MTIDPFRVRWNESKTPIMKGHMHINVRLQNYVARLPKTRINMMYQIRRKFRRKRSRG